MQRTRNLSNPQDGVAAKPTRSRAARLVAPTALLGALAAAAGLTGACTETQKAPAPATTPDAAATAPTTPALDAGALAAEPDAAPVDAGYTGPRLGALYLHTPIFSEMEFPKEKGTTVQRLGYLRQGALVPVVAEPHKKANCKEGWYELVAGGFVCGRYATLDLNHPKLKLAPHAPNLEGPLPYEYGYNVSNGTPLYRTIPSRQDRTKLEPWLVRKPKPKPVEEDAEGTLTRVSASAPFLDPWAPEAEDAGVPWYLREWDGGKPSVTLDELQGEGPIARRMVKGFYVALDQEMTANGAKWWRTTGNLIAPHERIFVQKPLTEFRGIAIDAETRQKLPELGRPGSKQQVAFVSGFKTKKFTVSDDRKAATAGEAISRRTAVRLTGQSAKVDGHAYDETDEGFWIRTSELRKAIPGPLPKGYKPGEKWIDVNLTQQMVLAYEGTDLVYATLTSTGKEDKNDPAKDHSTPTGQWRIREKHVAATMDGDVASDGPYSIEDVPWIAYFHGSYALHGAFWHGDFGRTRSHGCVNLVPEDARRLFAWADPQVPEGWHGVNATADRPGTTVVVHE